MKAIVGVKQVKEWTGQTLHDRLLGMVPDEHAELGTASKCGSQFEKHFVCCRPKGHSGFHFSRRFVVPGNFFAISALWEV